MPLQWFCVTVDIGTVTADVQPLQPQYAMLFTGSESQPKKWKIRTRLGTHTESRTRYGHLDECTSRNPHDTSSFVLVVTHATASYGWGTVTLVF